MGKMDIEEQNKIFFQRIAGIYDYIFGNWIINIQKRVIRLSNILKDAKILDAGCGTGNFLSLLEEKNLRKYGIDISKQMLAKARNKLRNTELRLYPVEKANFKNNYFDYIFSIDAFHHFYNKHAAMENLYRMLHHKGRLIIVDVDFGSFFNTIFQKVEPGNNGILTKEEMKKVFKEHRFVKISQRKVGWCTFMTSGMKKQ